MPYIPKEHEKYDLLPRCRKNGGEVFEYPSDLLFEAEQLIDSTIGLTPYGYNSYDEYDHFLDSLMTQYSTDSNIVKKLREVKEEIFLWNQKETWSILRY